MTSLSRRRSSLTLAAVAVMGVAVAWMVALVVRRYAEPVYLIGAARVWITVIAGLVALFSLIGLTSTRRYDLALRAGLTAGLLVAGLAAIFSIGIPLLVFSVLAGASLVRRPGGGTHRIAVMSGAGLAVGALVLTWSVLQPPAVVCRADGGASIRVDGRHGSISTESSNTGERASQGTARFNGSGFEYECRDGDLVRFELMP